MGATDKQVPGARRRSGQGSAREATSGFVAATRRAVKRADRAWEPKKGCAREHRSPPLEIPDSKLAREVTQIVRDTEPELLFNHSSRVYLFGALAGEHRGLKFDPELLYAGAMFHDMGLPRCTAATMSASRWTARMRRGSS